jgi:NADH-quinone oxidoreductase subunit N
VYAGAPPTVAALLATVARCAALAGLLRLLEMSDALATPAVTVALTLMALATLLAGHLLALLERDLVRLLAYSSIAQAGYLAVPLVAGGTLGLETAAVYALVHGAMVLLAFGVVTQLEADGDNGHRLEDCRGLMWRRPLPALLLATALVALAGLPPTLGFLGRYYLFAAAFEADLSLLLVALLVAGALGLYVHLRVIAVLLADGASDQPELGKGVAAQVWPVWLALGLLAGGLVALGLYPDPAIAWVRAFAAAPLP